MIISEDTGKALNKIQSPLTIFLKTTELLANQKQKISYPEKEYQKPEVDTIVNSEKFRRIF